MNSKKVNWFFLTTILLHIIIVVLLVVFRYVFTLDIVGNFLVSSAIILVPALLFLFFSNDRGNWRDAIGFRKLKWSSVGMIVLFTFLTMPLTTVINAFSMFFVDNAVAEISGEVMRLPFFLSFILMAVNAPVCEEIVFRGIAYQGYKKSGTLVQAAVFSALIFALGHMNFNQAAYAFVIGLLLILLVEATGSIWASIIYHVVFNGYSVCIMYLADYFFPEVYREMGEDMISYTDSLIYSIAVYIVIAAVTVSIAACVLIWIAKNENRTGRLKSIWEERHKKRGRILSVPFILAVILCIAFMIADVIL